MVSFAERVKPDFGSVPLEVGFCAGLTGGRCYVIATDHIRKRTCRAAHSLSMAVWTERSSIRMAAVQAYEPTRRSVSRCLRAAIPDGGCLSPIKSRVLRIARERAQS